MSAYGAIAKPSHSIPSTPVTPTSYLLPTKQALTVFPCTRASVDQQLISYLAKVFNDVVREGRTYPQQQELTEEEFANYFFSHDCFVGLLNLDLTVADLPATLKDGSIAHDANYSLETVKAGRSWEESVLGMFYVKPNYPGRSSHNCNGGFVVPTVHRGLRVGVNLGRAFLRFAPLLGASPKPIFTLPLVSKTEPLPILVGYKASVFNLVYVSNTASLRIWDSLGFNRVGLVPDAGLLKSAKEGEPDVFTDAIVYHKTFEAPRLLGLWSSGDLPNAHPRPPSPLSPRLFQFSPQPQNDIEGSPRTVTASIKALLLSGYINVLLIAVPLSFISHFAGWGSTADFIISFIAIVPLASLLGDATEQCSLKLGQTVGGLMNATFGNAVEAIVGIIALVKGELRIVQTSMLGSILSNLLLVLGCSFIAGGIKFKESPFQQTAAQASSSLMILACSTLIIPAAYHANRLEKLPVAADLLAAREKSDLAGLLTISRGTAIILLFCYAAYLYFQLKTHAYLFEDPQEQEEETAKMNLPTAVCSLVVVTVITSFCADYLVGAIEEFSTDFGIPKAFIGLILLPIVGNAAEHVTSVWMAMKGKMEITIGVSVGSSIQIAVGVVPLLVVVGWIIGQDLTLYFENFETAVLLISVLLVNLLIQDGKSNWLEGLMLVALAMWVS
ncbi:Ca2+:H+ antiporter, partial [Phenoliferia sp. Uapishka_3]